MALRALLLDFGNTLMAERTSRAGIYAEEARAAGLAVDEAGMRARMGRAHDALPRVVEGHFRYSDGWFDAFLRHIFLDDLDLDPARLPALAERLFARFRDPATFAPRPGARALLDAARGAGLRLALVSNWSPHLEPVLAGHGLLEPFDAVLASAREELEKPDPRLFARALERLGVAPERALHAGDHPRNDVEGALAAGLGAALVDPSGTMPLPPGALRVDDLHALRERVLERTR